jgi:hypothetical protein
LISWDDLSYARRDQAETSVLFELIVERYERKTLAITANAPFSAWDEVFPGKVMTVAAVDRPVLDSTSWKCTWTATDAALRCRRAGGAAHLHQLDQHLPASLKIVGAGQAAQFHSPEPGRLTRTTGSKGAE